MGTDKLSNVKHMNPYLSKERHEKDLSSPLPIKAPARIFLPADNMPAGAKQLISKPGNFMLYTGFGTKQKPFHLVNVIQYVGATDKVEFQWYNNGTKGPNVGHNPCWARILTNDDEVQCMRHPGRHLYKPMCETAALDDFCRCSVEVKQSSPTAPLRLTPAEIGCR